MHIYATCQLTSSYVRGVQLCAFYKGPSKCKQTKVLSSSSERELEVEATKECVPGPSVVRV